MISNLNYGHTVVILSGTATSLLNSTTFHLLAPLHLIYLDEKDRQAAIILVCRSCPVSRCVTIPNSSFDDC